LDNVWAKAYLYTKWHLDPSSRLATTDVDLKLGAVSVWGRGKWVPMQHNVPMAEAYTSVPSFILIHPTVWPQYTNVTDKTDRQDRQDRHTDRQRSDSIERTVL